ncbi:MAG: ArsR/SmtB family transcription factor [Nitrosopumilus sp.]
MPVDETSSDGITEKIKILATDDEKIKSYAELFTNDSSRKILQLLFNEELAATQIAQKTDVSLQLVKYHLNKLQALGVVTISKIEKNSKSQDMKIYSATKFSIVIVPPKLSEKTKESKLLVRSFRHIYKIVGVGIATGITWTTLSLTALKQGEQISVDDSVASRQMSSIEESAKGTTVVESVSVDESMRKIETSAPMSSETESQTGFDKITASEEFTQQDLDIVDSAINTDGGIIISSDLFLPFIVIGAILGGLTVYYLWKFFRKYAL